MVTSVLAIELIPSLFDKTQSYSSILFLTDEDFGREGYYDGVSYDGIINNFGISIHSAPSSVEEGQTAHIDLAITNLGASGTYGEMWVQCSILSEEDNHWLVDVSRRGGIGYKSPSSIYNCKDEDFTLTGKFFIGGGNIVHGIFDIPESQAQAGEDAVIYCAAYEQCANYPFSIDELETYTSSALKRSITILPQQQEPDVYTCTDPDGDDGWDTKSTVTVMKEGSYYPHDEQTDKCISSTQLKEFYCESSDSSNIGYEIHTCDGSCEDDACVDSSSTCIDEYEKKCYSDDVYWYDSCGVKGTRYDDCSSTETCSNGVCVGGGTTGSSDIRIIKIEVVDMIKKDLLGGNMLMMDDAKITVKNFGDATGTINLEWGIYSKYWLQKYNLLAPDTAGGINLRRTAELGEWDWKTPCAKFNDVWCKDNDDCQDFVTSGTIINLGPGESFVAPVKGIEGLFSMGGLEPSITPNSVFADRSSAVDPMGHYLIYAGLYKECGEEPENNAGISKQTIGTYYPSSDTIIFNADEGAEGTWAFGVTELEDEEMNGGKECTEFTERCSCDDKNRCTFDTCESGQCKWSLREEDPTCMAGTCPPLSEWDDNDITTFDTCDASTGYKISHEPILNSGEVSHEITATQSSLTKKDLEEATYSTILSATCQRDENCKAYDPDKPEDYDVKCVQKAIYTQKIEEAVDEKCNSFLFTKYSWLGAGATCVGTIGFTIATLGWGAPSLIACPVAIGAATTITAVDFAQNAGCELFNVGEANGLCIAAPPGGDLMYNIKSVVADILGVEIDDPMIGYVLIGLIFIAFFIFYSILKPPRRR